MMIITSVIVYLTLKRSYTNRLSRYILNRFKTDNNIHTITDLAEFSKANTNIKYLIK